jgi:hypothetical protein
MNVKRILAAGARDLLKNLASTHESLSEPPRILKDDEYLIINEDKTNERREQNEA